MSLAEFWFVLVAFLFAGYFFLEGFDFGVGMLLPVLGRDDTGRRVMINTIGPVWDMNETWLIVAGASHVRRLPVLVRHPVQRVLPAAAADPGRVDRARGRVRVPGQGRRRSRWRRRWDACIVVGSVVPALLWGVAFANIVRGVPIDADGNYTGTLFTLLNPFGLLGGLATVALFCTYGAIFVALKTVGTIRQRSPRRWRPGSAWSRCCSARHSWSGRCWRTATRHPRCSPCSPRPPWSRDWWPTPVSAKGGRSAWSAASVVGLVATLFVALYPGRHALEHGPGVQPHHRQRQLHAHHLGHHVLGGAVHPAVRARLPGVDLLGVPQAHRARQHPDPPQHGADLQHAGGDPAARPRAARARPLDPRLLRYSRSSRPFLLVCVLLGLLVRGCGAGPGGAARRA